MEQLLSVDEVARRLGVSARSLLDKRYRTRIGLPCVKIGRLVKFALSDVDALIERGRQKQLVKIRRIQ